MSDEKKLTLEEAYKFGMAYINNSAEIGWNDLADTNSLWDHLSEDMTEAEVKIAAKEAFFERISEDELVEAVGLNPSDLWIDK